MNRWFWMLLLLNQPQASEEASIAVSTDLEPEEGRGLRVGSPFRVVISVAHAGRGIVTWPADIDAGPDIVIRARGVERTRPENPAGSGSVVDQLVLTAVPFAVGTLSLGPFDARLGDQPVPVPPVRFVVQSSLPPEVAGSTLTPEKVEQLAAPDPVPPVPLRFNRWFGLAVLIVVAVLGLGWLWWRRRRRQRSVQTAPLPPKVEALRALEALRTELDGAPAIPLEEGFIRLSLILRRYLFRAYRVDAEKLSNPELEARLPPLPTDEARLLFELLVGADFVKFASAPVTLVYARHEVDRAMGLVERLPASIETSASASHLAPAAFPAEPTTAPVLTDSTGSKG
ncbi:MAG: DUF4381 family protein [Myxococcota bacterium]